MSIWLYSLVGVIFVSIMIDIISPKGKFNELIKTIIGLVAIIIIIRPIVSGKFVTSLKLDINNQNIYLENSMQSYYKTLIINSLNSVGISGINVEINTNISDNSCCINNILIDKRFVVLTENYENININEIITNDVSKITGVDSERIIIYE